MSDLMSIDEMAEKLEIFESFSRVSIANFLRIRGVKPARKHVKTNFRGSLPWLYNIHDVIEAWARWPINSRKSGYTKEYWKSRKYKSKYDHEDCEKGNPQPFRNIKCPKYYECLDKAARLTTGKKESGKLDCRKCEHKETVDPKYLLQGVL